MNDLLLSMTSYAINAIWQLPLMFAAGWCLSRCLKPMDPEIQHRVWVIVLIGATLSPAIPFFRPYFAQSASSSNRNVASSAISVSVGDRYLPLISSDVVLTPTAIYFISGLYIASLLFFSIRLCWQIGRTSTLVDNAGPASLNPSYEAMWNGSKEHFSIRTAALLLSDEVSGPVTAGLRNPVVLLPVAFSGETLRTDFLAAVGHECAHIRRKDYRKNLFYEVVAVITAFHPATWFIKSQIAQTREMVCDRMAAEQFFDRRAYGQCLIRLATRMAPAAPSGAFHTIGLFDRNSLERRIMMLMISSPRITRIRRYFLGGTVVVLVSIWAGVIGLFTQPVSAQSPRQTQSDKKQESGTDLTCTFYDKGVGFPGTCGRDKQDKSKYACYKVTDSTVGQGQNGCEWKVLKAEQAQNR